MVVGLTGGMGTGKSVVARILRSLGYPVYAADERAKSLYLTDGTLKSGMKHRFGSDVFDTEGVLDRQALAERVFGDDEELRALNALVHPAVARDFEEWKDRCASSGSKVVFREAAILFESGSDSDCDMVWAVSAPLDLRLARISSRNGWTREEIDRRLVHQWPAEEVESRADVVIPNDGNKALVPVILSLLTCLLYTSPSPRDQRGSRMPSSA